MVSEIALGSWLTYGGGVGRERAEACVAKAFEVGIDFIDTANVYSRGRAEEFLGEVLAGRSSSGRCPTEAGACRANRSSRSSTRP
jgi:aryl-alcohol dehydrogenase-like predicted oxidoreductase